MTEKGEAKTIQEIIQLVCERCQMNCGHVPLKATVEAILKSEWVPLDFHNEKIQKLEADLKKANDKNKHDRKVIHQTWRRKNSEISELKEELATAKQETGQAGRQIELMNIEMLKLEKRISEAQQHLKESPIIHCPMEDAGNDEFIEFIVDFTEWLEKLRAILQEITPRNMTHGTINNPNGSSWQPEKERAEVKP